ncbi:hypothetical protein [Vibrio parahaemolyticus]|uniref:hypothetical protein n=1 Tax=Vibrio parahaemolyticus TaxID=670 RepID=UPI00236059B2|nr:hypothetical protein [Vibrio parahaemolyticus]MDQ2216408.1 hypothetical protein [Vibrio parahaemolyticus]
MTWFKKQEEKELVVLSGVEDYLTESAKKYKRNLMYSMLIIFTLTLINSSKLIDSTGFTSLFGFQLNGKDVVPFYIVIAVLTVVCLYECVMLFTYKEVCDNHWFGNGFIKNVSEPNETKKESRRFEERIKLINYEFQSEQEIKRRFEQQAEEIKQIIENKLFPDLDSVVELRLSELQQIKGAFYRQKGAGSSTELIETNYENQVREKYEDIINSLERYLQFTINSRKRIVKCIVKENECWKRNIANQIQKNIKVHNELSNQINKLTRPYGRIVFVEFWMPLILGSGAICVGAYQSIPALNKLLEYIALLTSTITCVNLQ